MAPLISPELSLDSAFLSKDCVRRTTEEFIAQCSEIQVASDRIVKLNDFVKRLQDEMKKIEAFKRELPLCMILLADAVVIMMEEVDKCKAAESVLEEFIPLKRSWKDDKDEGAEGVDISKRDRVDWMSSVQLWNSGDNCDSLNNNKLISKLDIEKERMEEEASHMGMANSYQRGKNKAAMVMAFVPYNVHCNLPMAEKESANKLPVPMPSLCTPQIKNSREINVIGFSLKSTYGVAVPCTATNVQSNFNAGHEQVVRKQRRCWSSELHRRFVDALQQLGGPQAATPKQIRELMQVDGLTNDEVKSHLQKYRMHTRRVTASTSSWMSQDQWDESLKPLNAQTRSPQGPLQLSPRSDKDEDCQRSDPPIQPQGILLKN